MDTTMDYIITSTEDEEDPAGVGSLLRQSARSGLTTAVDDLQPFIEELIDKTVVVSTDDDPERVDRWENLNLNIRVALREHLRSRVYDHIDRLAGGAEAQNTDADDQLGNWETELSVEEKEMAGSVLSFEAELVSQGHPQFEEMVGISSTITVTPDLKTISVQPTAFSAIETSGLAQKVLYDGVRRPGLRDEREGSSETVFVEDASRRIAECNEVILRDIKALVAQAGDDIRPILESDLVRMDSELADIKESLVGYMEDVTDLRPALMIDLSQWNLTLETYVPHTTEDDAPNSAASQRAPLVGSTAHFEAMTRGRKRFQLCIPGGPLSDELSHVKIDYLPSEELVNRWESLQRSRR